MKIKTIKLIRLISKIILILASVFWVIQGIQDFLSKKPINPLIAGERDIIIAMLFLVQLGYTYMLESNWKFIDETLDFVKKVIKDNEELMKMVEKLHIEKIKSTTSKLMDDISSSNEEKEVN